jgi:ABC-type Fe3+ transport system substrate-binding protein
VSAASAAAATIGSSALLAPAPQRGELVVYDQGASFVNEVQDGLVTRFESRGVDVTLVEGTADQLTSKFGLERPSGVRTADVLTVWDPVGVRRLVQEGLLTTYIPPRLEARILPRDRQPLLVHHWGVTCIAFNPQKLAQMGLAPPQSFRDLADSAYAQRLILVDPLADQSALRILAFAVHDLGYGWDFVRALKENGAVVTPTWRAPTGPPEHLLDPSSPVAVGVAGWGRAYPLEREGKPIKTIIPDEGGLGTPQVVAIARDTPQLEIAQAYVDEVLFAPELLDWWAQQRFLPVSVQGVSMPPGVPPPEAIREVDYDWVAKNELTLRLQWQQIFAPGV